MYKTPSLFILLLSGIFLFSCSTSKFDYNKAYTFKKYTYKNENNNDQVKEDHKKEFSQATASLERVLTNPDISQHNIQVKPLEAITPEYEAIPLKEMDRAERKTFRKEIKKELKKIKKAVKPSKKSIKSEEATNAIDKWVYIGLIIGGAGLVLLIIDVASPLGAIALVVGLGFIVYGLLSKRGVV